MIELNDFSAGGVEESLVEDTNNGVKSPARSTLITKNKNNGGVPPTPTARHPKGPDGSKGFQPGKR